VDGNADAADTLVDLLRYFDFDARAAYSSAAALRVAEQFLPGVVVLDVELGDADGLDTVRQLRAADWGKTPRIIALTAWDDDRTRRRVSAAGLERHLVKPSSAADILHAIEHPVGLSCET
jgi:DNA-binding response OmpR family regulator